MISSQMPMLLLSLTPAPAPQASQTSSPVEREITQKLKL